MSRDEMTDRLFVVFRDRGFDGASMAELASATGLGKSSLYHAFPGGKDEMARAVLARVRALMEGTVLTVLGGAGTIPLRIKRMAEAIDTLYANGNVGCLVGTFSLGQSGRRFRPELRDIFGAWIDALAGVLREAGIAPADARRRAEDALAAIEGTLVLACGTGDAAAFRRLVKALPRRLLERSG